MRIKQLEPWFTARRTIVEEPHGESTEVQDEDLRGSGFRYLMDQIKWGTRGKGKEEKSACPACVEPRRLLCRKEGRSLSLFAKLRGYSVSLVKVPLVREPNLTPGRLRALDWNSFRSRCLNASIRSGCGEGIR
jgi:hypothetical protein